MLRPVAARAPAPKPCSRSSASSGRPTPTSSSPITSTTPASSPPAAVRSPRTASAGCAGSTVSPPRRSCHRRARRARLAQRLNVGDSVIYRWINADKLNAHRVGRRKLAITFNDEVEVACRNGSQTPSESNPHARTRCWRCSMKTPSTSSPTGAGSATSPTSPTTAAAGSSEAPRAATPRPCRSSSRRSASAGSRSGRSRSTCPAATRRPSAPRCPTPQICLRPVPRRHARRATPSTTCAAPSGTPSASRARPRASPEEPALGAAQGARDPHRAAAHRALRRSSRPTPSSTAPTCSRRRSAPSTSSRPPLDAPAHLDAWLAWATRSNLKPFVNLARTLRHYRDASSPPSSSASPTPGWRA